MSNTRNMNKDKDTAFPKLSSVNYDAIMDRQVGDKRFEREKAHKDNNLATSSSSTVSSTFDAFQRMAAGLDGRTLADKMSDPNRPTWEQYKKENESKLDLVGNEVRKMVEYRAELDRERDNRLKGRKRDMFVEDSDEEDERRSSKKQKKDKDKKKHKKHKKQKDDKAKDNKDSGRDGKDKSRKKKRSSDDSDGDSSGSDSRSSS